MGLFLQGLPGRPSGLPVGGMDLLGTHSPPRLHLGGSGAFGSRHWGREGQIWLRVDSGAGVLVLGDGQRVGCLAVGRMVGCTGLRIGSAPLLGGLCLLWGVVSRAPLSTGSVSLGQVWTPVGGPLDNFIPGQSFSYPDSINGDGTLRFQFS